MEIKVKQLNGINIAEIDSEDILIRNVQNAIDLMADCSYQGSGNIILHEYNIISEFFDLKTGFAGEILQKFSNYRAKLAIVGDFSKYSSKNLKDFIYESNKYGRILFAGSLEEAYEKLSRSSIRS
jgi:hypothetical protein